MNRVSAKVLLYRRNKDRPISYSLYMYVIALCLHHTSDGRRHKAIRCREFALSRIESLAFISLIGFQHASGSIYLFSCLVPGSTVRGV